MVSPVQAAAHSGEVAPASSKAPVSHVIPDSSQLRVILIVAAVATGCAIGAIAGRQAGRGPSVLQTVARADLDQSIPYLERTIPPRAIEEARQCKIPIPYVTLQAAVGTTPDRVRIRSGNYLSPWLLLNGTPQRIAVPFPAPYTVGKGELFIEGATRPLTLWLSPAVVIGPQVTPSPIPITWNTSNPCHP